MRFSTLVALHSPWMHNGTVNAIETEETRRTDALLRDITQKVSVNLAQGECQLGVDIEAMSPWGLFFGYHLCRELERRAVECSPEVDALAKTLRTTMLEIDGRWNASGRHTFMSQLLLRSLTHRCRIVPSAARGTRNNGQVLNGRWLEPGQQTSREASRRGFRRFRSSPARLDSFPLLHLSHDMRRTDIYSKNLTRRMIYSGHCRDKASQNCGSRLTVKKA